MTKPKVDPEVLRDLYVTQGLTIHQVASRIGVHPNTARLWIHKHGIPMRPPIAAQSTATVKDRNNRSQRLAALRVKQAQAAQRLAVVNEQIAEEVALAREEDVPWSDIGKALDIARATAQEKYGI